MALAVTVRFDFVDASDKKSFTEVNVPVGFTIAQIVEFTQDMEQILTNISQCQLTGASISISLNISGAIIKTVAGAFADVAEKAHYVFSSVVTGFRKLLKIPTREELQEVSGSDSMNTALTTQATFIALIEDGIVVAGPATILFTDNYMNDIAALNTARTVLMTTAA